MSKEAMQLALEALENSIDLVSHEARNAEELYGKYPTRLARIQSLVAFEVAHEKAIAALRQALANEALDKKAENARELGLDYEPAQQEPVAWISKSKNLLSWDMFYDDMTPLYTSPPAQRTWVGLTLEDMETTHWSPDFRAGAKWAAAKLKEKNT